MPTARKKLYHEIDCDPLDYLNGERSIQYAEHAVSLVRLMNQYKLVARHFAKHHLSKV